MGRSRILAGLLAALALSTGAYPRDDAPMWAYRYVLATATDPTQKMFTMLGEPQAVSSASRAGPVQPARL